MGIYCVCRYIHGTVQTTVFEEIYELAKTFALTNNNPFIHKESNSRCGFRVVLEILWHNQHTAIVGEKILEIQFFCLRTLNIW